MTTKKYINKRNLTYKKKKSETPGNTTCTPNIHPCVEYPIPLPHKIQNFNYNQNHVFQIFYGFNFNNYLIRDISAV